MNYFAHGRAQLSEPYRLAGTALPDWLSVVDRRARLRPARLAALARDGDPELAALVAGALRHFHDDAWFHATTAFAEVSAALTVLARDALRGDPSLRPWFLGHVLLELLLDAKLIAAEPARLTAYYRAVEAVDAERLAGLVARLVGRPVDRLAWLVEQFCAERFLLDYLDDEKLLFRLGQVLRRVRLGPLPSSFGSLLPAARGLVAARCDELLAEPGGRSIEGDRPLASRELAERHAPPLAASPLA